MIDVKIKKLNKDAIIPNQPYEGDAGFDLYAVEDVTLKPQEYTTIPTGLSIVVPNGYAELIWDKSGISTKNGLKHLGVS